MEKCKLDEHAELLVQDERFNAEIDCGCWMPELRQQRFNLLPFYPRSLKPAYSSYDRNYVDIYSTLLLT